MRFVYKKPTKGNMIRVKAGLIYHYGIYIDNNNIIQFGPNPLDESYMGKEKKVMVTDLKSFLKDSKLLVGIPSASEQKKMFKKEEVILNAKKRIGESGYNIIHNNCEHFVYECMFGYKKCSIADLVRKKYRNRNILDVYIKKISNENIKDVYPNTRNKEIKRIKNKKVAQEKYEAWELLRFAIKRTFNMDILDLTFHKSKMGRWYSNKIKFSISHSNDYLMVGVSNKACGVDIEKNKGKEYTDKLKRKVCLKKEENKDFMETWTKKESIFKYLSDGLYNPLKIDISKYETYTSKLNDYTYSICGKLDGLHIYLVENDEAKRL